MYDEDFDDDDYPYYSYEPSYTDRTGLFLAVVVALGLLLMAI